MNIIIVGCGKVGYTLAESLSKDSQNAITVIDNDPDTLDNAFESLDVSGFRGNGASPATLIKAGTAAADLFIATTDSDERNIVCCLTARKIGASHTIARVRDPGYAEELEQTHIDFGLNLVINPEQIVAGEITRHLEFNLAANIEMFSRGRVMMLEIKIQQGMPIESMPLRDISRRISTSVLIGAIRRGDDVIIPSGDDRVLRGDRIFILGQPPRVSAFCDALGLRPNKLRNVMIVGGGRVAFYLASHLASMGVRTKIIESDEERCAELSDLLPNSLIINGDGTDDKLLASENLGSMDGFVSVTGMDEENLMTALLAKHAGVRNVIAKVNRSGYTKVSQGFGIDSIVNPKTLTANAILRYVRGLTNAHGNTINALYPIVDDLAEAVELTANASTEFIDIPLRRVQLTPNVLVATIVHKGGVIIPFGGDMIHAGDDVILFAKGRQISDLNEVFVRVRDA